MTRKWLKPDWDPGLTLPEIPISHFKERKIKALFLDVDKTILHGKSILINKSVKEWILEAKLSMKLHLLSNNPSRNRIMNVANQLKITYTHGASKPRRKATQDQLDKIDLYPNEIAIVGDRIFTDILLGNRLGLYTVLIKPIQPQEIIDKNNYIQNLEKLFAGLLGSSRL